MPLYDDDDRLDIRPYAPIIRPVPIPQADISDGPIYCLAGNAEWLHRLVGALHVLEQPDAWIGTDSERFAAIQNVKELLARIHPCPGDSEVAEMFSKLAVFRLRLPDGSNSYTTAASAVMVAWSSSTRPHTLVYSSPDFPFVSGTYNFQPGTYKFRATVPFVGTGRSFIRFRHETTDYVSAEVYAPVGGPTAWAQAEAIFTIGEGQSSIVNLYAHSELAGSLGAPTPETYIATEDYIYVEVWAVGAVTGAPGPPGPRGFPGEPGPAGPTMPIALRVSPLTPHAIEASYVGESGGDWWHTGLLACDIVDLCPPQLPDPMMIALRVSPLTPHAIEASYVGESGGDWWHTGLLACDIADLCQPVIDWTTTADPYPRAILQYGKPGELQDHPFPFPTPGPDFRLRVADDRTVEGRWQTGEIPSPWHDTGLEACDIVLACAIGPEDPIPPDTGPDDLCIKAYRFAEYYQNAMNDVLDTIAGESGHLQKTIGALGILSLYTGLTAPVAIGMGIGSMILEIVDGGIENTRDAFGPAYWQAYAEDLYCDMRQVLQTEAYTAAHYFAWFEPWIEDHAGSLPSELWAKAILGSIHPKKANEWAAQSLTMPPAGACQNCPDLEQVLTLDFAAGIPSGVTVESGQHVEDQGLRSALWMPRDRHMNAAIVGQAAPGEAGHITRIVATIFNDGSAISYSMPLESRNSAYAFQTLGSSYTMVDQWWGLAGLNEYTYTPLSPIQISNVGLRVLFNMWTRFADQQAAEAGYSYLQTLKIYYVGDSVQWGVT